MRPTPSETIAGVRRLLGEVMDTCQIDGYARARLSEIEAALGQVDWDDALTEVANVNGTSGGLIRDALDWMDVDPSAHADVAIDRTHLDALLDDCSPVQPFSQHNGRYAALQQVAVRLIDHLAGWVNVHPEDEAAVALLDRFHRHYSARRRRPGPPRS